jgi:flagellar biosynthesis chaperone FliJ
MVRTILTALAALSLTHAQVIYNQQRDSAAQNALTLAEGISNGAVFEKQLANLERLNRFSQERVFAEAEIQMRANLLTLGSWSRVQTFVTQVGSRISKNQSEINGSDFKKSVQTAKDNLDAASKELEELKKKAVGKDPAAALNAFGETLGRIGKLNDLRHFLDGLPNFSDNLPKAYADAADEISRLALSLKTLYAGFKLTLPKSTESVAMETHLAILELEESHQSALAAIAARRDREVGDTLTGIAELNNELKQIRGNQSTDDLLQSLTAVSAAAKSAGPDQQKNQDLLGIMVHALYGAASLAARDETPERLANLRIASENRANSIRSSAAAAAGYEQMILNGVQRLALYYQGGIKPQTIAQIVTALSTLGLIPTVLTR